MAQLDLFFVDRDDKPSTPPGASTAQLELLGPSPRPKQTERRAPTGGFRLSIQGQVRLEGSLRARLGPRIVVTQTSNRSTMISFRRKGQALYVRVHAMFADADEGVLDALAEFISKDEISAEHAAALDDFIEKHRPHLTEVRARSVRLRPYGEVHDLSAIYDYLNETYFERKVDAQITWSNAQRKRRRTSINMGTYSDELRLIRIHPALDQAWVPRFFVEAVVFHEMLHQIHDVKDEGGRRCIHSAEFRRDERRFPRFADAQRWERKNLSRLLRY